MPRGPHSDGHERYDCSSNHASNKLLQPVSDAVIYSALTEEAFLRYFDRLQPLALLVLRVVLGVIMIGHGYSKVFGGLSHHAQFVSSLGIPAWLAYCSAAAEFFGGILVIAGLFTRCAALAILINLSVAIAKVHWKNGLLGNGGYQFPLALAAIAFALIFFGAGPIAFDSIRRGGVRVKSKSSKAS
jgi:putative oxidoreductase